MITVRDLARKLRDYVNMGPEHGSREVMLAFDGDVAFPFLEGNDHVAMSPAGGVEKFLVLVPDQRGKKLALKGRQ